MNRDPHLDMIRERLNSGVDPHAFEDAVVDLLRNAYSGLASVAGGSDSGMDGAIADGQGEPIPLVTTTASSAIGNLTRNLKKYVEDGMPRRKVVFATSRSLSAQQKQNLYKRARELRFTLLNIHDQHDLATRLYRDSKLCRNLLGLTGEPPALSTVARSWRPYSEQPLVGRDASLAWLRNLSGDGLLVGQPGSGKTYLLQRLVDDERYGLFVTSRDREMLAAAIRDQEPSTIIIDDAHVDEEHLLDLVHLRRELGARYRILAVSWPGDAHRISRLLSLSGEDKHDLQLLTRDEIVEVVRGAGIEAPLGLVAEIVNQAEGRPGLAVTLTHMCRTHTVAEVLSGEALGHEINGAFEHLVGPRAKQILAAHALAGDAGLPMSTVATALGLDLAIVQESLTKLAAGGVIFEGRDGRHLSVRPPALRHVLVRDVFFAGPLSLPESTRTELLQHAPPAEAAQTILGARARGATVPLAEAAELARRSSLWEEFAWSGRDAVRWILAHQPEHVVAIAKPALSTEPSTAIPLLLNHAVGDERALHSHPGHPLRLIQSWVRATRHGDEAFSRRSALHRAVLAWSAAGGDHATAARCVPMIFDPRFDHHETDPGAGMTVYLHRGALDASVYERVHAMWPAILTAFAHESLRDWGPLIEAVDDWFFARADGGDEEVDSKLRSMGAEMLHALAAVAEHHPAVRQRLRRMARFRNLEDTIPADPVFDVLFPIDRLDPQRLDRDQEEQKARIQALATEWAELSPEAMADRLEFVDREQALVGLSYPNYAASFTSVLAGEVSAPNALVRVLMQRGASASTLFPFLESCAAGTEAGWLELLDAALDSSAYEKVAVLVALRRASVPASTASLALRKIARWPGIAEAVCRDATTPPPILLALLEHEDDKVAQRAMHQLGYRYVHDKLPDVLTEAWMDTLCRHAKAADAWLVKQVVKGNRTLARRWLEALMAADTSRYLLLPELDDAIPAAAAELPDADRAALLEVVPSSYGWEDLVAVLVADNDDLYNDLLQRPDLAHLHLQPLVGATPDDAWQRKALRALEAGYAPSDLAGTLLHRGGSWAGPQSRYWQGRIDELDALLTSEREELREVGRTVRTIYASRRDRAAHEERQEAIFGHPLR